MAGKHVRPRWGRISAATTAVLVTLVTMLAAVGLVPAGASPAAAHSDTSTHGASGRASRSASTPTSSPAPTSTPTPSAGEEDTARSNASSPGEAAGSGTAVPALSGTGRRVVFDMSDQRVWLVDADGSAERTYLVSGSLTDNLHPGTYSVYSTSRWAVGVDDSGVMQYFVRFTHGAHAAIGFHSIPTKHGKQLETRAQLGSPQSHGCIRQWLPDAKALWDFAPVGTKVVVTA